MNPAFSVITFTAVAGAAQGMVVGLALATLTGVPVGAGFVGGALLLALALLGIGLGASFLHLGRPERAWRAMMMWRTSWLSREVIVLPAFMAVVGLWWLALRLGANGSVATIPLPALWPVLALAMAALLWLCTAQIYACLRFIQEWAHPLTLVNYTLVGLASGLVLLSALAGATGEHALLSETGPRALAFTLAAWATRTLALRRNARLTPRSTAQSATGLKAARVVQKSMGMSAGAFNTREFFHHASQAAVRHVRTALHVLGFGLPALLMGAALLSGPLQGGTLAAATVWWCLALAVQLPGVFAERWLFFAQARHPQNLYYQAVS